MTITADDYRVSKARLDAMRADPELSSLIDLADSMFRRAHTEGSACEEGINQARAKWGFDRMPRRTTYRVPMAMQVVAPIEVVAYENTPASEIREMAEKLVQEQGPAMYRYNEHVRQFGAWSFRDPDAAGYDWWHLGGEPTEFPEKPAES